MFKTISFAILMSLISHNAHATQDGISELLVNCKKLTFPVMYFNKNAIKTSKGHYGNQYILATNTCHEKLFKYFDLEEIKHGEHPPFAVPVNGRNLEHKLRPYRATVDYSGVPVTYYYNEKKKLMIVDRTDRLQSRYPGFADTLGFHRSSKSLEEGYEEVLESNFIEDLKLVCDYSMGDFLTETGLGIRYSYQMAIENPRSYDTLSFRSLLNDSRISDYEENKGTIALVAEGCDEETGKTQFKELNIDAIAHKKLIESYDEDYNNMLNYSRSFQTLNCVTDYLQRWAHE